MKKTLPLVEKEKEDEETLKSIQNISRQAVEVQQLSYEIMSLVKNQQEKVDRAEDNTEVSYEDLLSAVCLLAEIKKREGNKHFRNGSLIVASIAALAGFAALGSIGLVLFGVAGGFSGGFLGKKISNSIKSCIEKELVELEKLRSLKLITFLPNGDLAFRLDVYEVESFNLEGRSYKKYIPYGNKAQKHWVDKKGSTLYFHENDPIPDKYIDQKRLPAVKFIPYFFGGKLDGNQDHDFKSWRFKWSKNEDWERGSWEYYFPSRDEKNVKSFLQNVLFKMNLVEVDVAEAFSRRSLGSHGERDWWSRNRKVNPSFLRRRKYLQYIYASKRARKRAVAINQVSFKQENKVHPLSTNEKDFWIRFEKAMNETSEAQSESVKDLALQQEQIIRTFRNVQHINEILLRAQRIDRAPYLQGSLRNLVSSLSHGNTEEVLSERNVKFNQVSEVLQFSANSHTEMAEGRLNQAYVLQKLTQEQNQTLEDINERVQDDRDLLKQLNK
eukprot:snap_masked-scaffold_15-processed-gene-9.7-mRNA-1 protein AED:1.00 eAED:1.00 QI:0/-1/0/0/-1/1/1/0/497